MAAWSDIESSSPKKDEEHTTNLCLMTNSEKMRYLILKSDLDFSIIKL